jgi:hypothetical protein
MYKFTKGSLAEKAKSDIWSDGTQFAPLDPNLVFRT